MMTIRMHMDSKYCDKVLVIGGGIAGLASAYYLAKSGRQVTLIERGDLTDGCSFGNAGMIVPSHFTPMAAPGIVSQGIKWMFDRKSPFYVKPSLNWSLLTWGMRFLQHANEKHVLRASPALKDLHLYSSQLYDQLATELSTDFDLQHKGILMLYKTGSTEEEEIHLANRARDMGLDVAVLNKDEVQALEPGVKLDVLGAVHYKCDGHLYPPALIQTLISELKKMGVELQTGVQVEGFDLKAGRIEKTYLSDGGQIQANQIVLTGGAWMGNLARKVNLSIPIMPGKGYSFLTDVFEGKVQHPALLMEARVALTPMGGKVRIGGTMELAPIDHQINLNRVEGIVKAVGSYYPEYNLNMPEKKDIWFGFRPCSPDGLPYLGYSRKVSNLVLAGGLGMMGLSLGPAIGQSVADLINGKTLQADIQIFDPERFN